MIPFSLSGHGYFATSTGSLSTAIVPGEKDGRIGESGFLSSKEQAARVIQKAYLTLNDAGAAGKGREDRYFYVDSMETLRRLREFSSICLSSPISCPFRLLHLPRTQFIHIAASGKIEAYCILRDGDRPYSTPPMEPCAVREEYHSPLPHLSQRRSCLKGTEKEAYRFASQLLPHMPPPYRASWKTTWKSTRTCHPR